MKRKSESAVPCVQCGLTVLLLAASSFGGDRVDVSASPALVVPQKKCCCAGASRIEALISQARAEGRKEAVVPKVDPATGCAVWTIERAIRLPADFTLVLDGAHLIMGTNTFDNMFRADGVSGVSLLGRNGATADGGIHNGLTERTAEKNGMPPIWKNNLLLFTNVRDFRVEGIRFVKQRWWALNFVACSEGVIRNIDFLADHSSKLPDGSTVDYLTQEDYEATCVKNADGIDLRAGCHDILVENITGFTEDDSVALTCMAWRFEKLFLRPGTPYEISNITLRNINTSSYCANVRILAQGGKIRHVVVDGVRDASDGTTYVHGRGASGVNIGDDYQYGQEPCRPGDVSDIVVKNVRSRAHWGVRIRDWADVKLENVVGFDGCPHVVADERKK